MLAMLATLHILPKQVFFYKKKNMICFPVFSSYFFFFSVVQGGWKLQYKRGCIWWETLKNNPNKVNTRTFWKHNSFLLIQSSRGYNRVVKIKLILSICNRSQSFHQYLVDWEQYIQKNHLTDWFDDEPDLKADGFEIVVKKIRTKKTKTPRFRGKLYKWFESSSGGFGFIMPDNEVWSLESGGNRKIKIFKKSTKTTIPSFFQKF